MLSLIRYFHVLGRTRYSLNLLKGQQKAYQWSVDKQIQDSNKYKGSNKQTNNTWEKHHSHTSPGGLNSPCLSKTCILSSYFSCSFSHWKHGVPPNEAFSKPQLTVHLGIVFGDVIGICLFNRTGLRWKTQVNSVS